MAALRCIVWSLPLLVTRAQLPGMMKEEAPPPVAIAHCSVEGGCKLEQGYATLDANWRWTHSQQCTGNGTNRQCSTAGNCYTGSEWDAKLCKDPKSCAKNCALEGVEASDYEDTYGVSPVPGGLKLKFVSMGAGGMNVGSRLYLMDSEDTYKLFQLKNREFTFDVDVSRLPCGLNGAVYFSEMEADGGLGGSNKAGAKYGTGYCDAQCPHDVKWMAGEANVLKWNVTDATGSFGACCTEMDIWEANAKDTAYTPHVCDYKGNYICNGTECGDILTNERYKGVCDKDGCDFNSYRLGEKKFFGEGNSFDVDSSKPITIVTQWITEDGLDDGDLSEIRRLYIQNGKVIKNSRASILGKKADYDSITDDFCRTVKKEFGDPDDFSKKGGLKKMGEALDRGMVLVMSLWDDKQAHMLWLDSDTANSSKYSKPGTVRGPCPRTSGVPEDVRSDNPEAYVTYTNIMYGELFSTYTVKADQKPENAEKALQAEQEKKLANSVEEAQHEKEQKEQEEPQEHPQQPVEGMSSAPAASSYTPGKAAAYQQCSGGADFNGPTECEEGCLCQINGGYGQCVPPEGTYLCSPSQPGDAVWVVERKHLSSGPSQEAERAAMAYRHPVLSTGIALCGIAGVALLLVGAVAAIKARPRQRAGAILARQPAYNELRVEHGQESMTPALATSADLEVA